MKKLPVISGSALSTPSRTTMTPAPRSYERETQAYSTWGGKLLQHTDVLYKIQKERKFTPITVQLAPTETCFTGDTKVSLLDGTEVTLKDLADRVEPFWVYSYDCESKKIVPGRSLRSRLTRQDVPILAVTLDNGEVIRCTEDHKFLMRDGSYERADRLVAGSSLMSTTASREVVSIKPAGREDVYCLEVEKFHNFALSAGVFVSNCSSKCPFCSVDNRPNGKIPWVHVEKLLRDFRELGAKAVELTGGGDPLLYRDGDKNINDVIELATDLGYEVGVITDSNNLGRHLRPEIARRLFWVRVSLIKLDEGKEPEDYDFSVVPEGRVALSYIIYEGTDDHVGTSVESIQKIARVVELNPAVKFVRLASNCLTDESITIKEKWGGVVEALNTHSKFFIKEINDNFQPFQDGCWVGMLRPYLVSEGCFICTSHTLVNRGYHPTWRLCGNDEIKETWDRMNARFAAGLPPYEIDIAKECGSCYYHNNNRLLHDVITPLTDANFA